MCGSAPGGSNTERRGCSQGRWLVQGIVHSFGATRCIILHLVTSQSLQHAAGNAEVPLVVYSLVIAVVALFCIQVRCRLRRFRR